MFFSKILRAADHPYLEGAGGRKVINSLSRFYYSIALYKINNKISSLQGMTIKSLKHHVALQPLFIIMGAGVVFVAVYIGR